MDKLSAEQRHKNMAAIHSKNTKPEWIVRRGLWSRGFRYRLAKIRRNQERDVEEQKRLAEMGWHCITIWECELKPSKREATLKSLVYTLNKIWLDDHQAVVSSYPQIVEESEGYLKAAEERKI